MSKLTGAQEAESASVPLQRLEEIAEINPRPDRASVPDDLQVSFVPMEAVGAGDGSINVGRERPAHQVKRGYTGFRAGDVLFAKITPCMENGKMAVVPELKNGIGFGSTEFHVIRPKLGIEAKYIYHYVSRAAFRAGAAHHMTGAVGQKRVPANFLKQSLIPVAPRDKQKQIVAEIEKQFSRLDEAVANLKRVRANVKRYRGAVLSAAAEGTLLGGKKAGGGAVTLGVIAQRITSGSRDWSRYYGRGRGTFVLAQNVRPGRLDMTMRQAVDPPPGDRDRARSQVERDDILVTIVGANTGDVCRVDREYQEHYVCQSVALIRLHDPRLAPYVTLYMLSPNHGQRQFDQFMYGQGRPHLSFDQLKTMLLDMPPKDEQSRIVAEVERRLSMADENEAQVDANLRRAKGLRQAILKRAFEGNLG